ILSAYQDVYNDKRKAWERESVNYFSANMKDARL
ncbi:hypothetical protein MHK_000497, partial [Candidatus Magnetomorum sp. HK-1]